MAKYVMGDIHGCYSKLIACLEAVNFDYDNDTLIQLGDVVDRGPDSYLCIEELLKIKNLVAIKGNHDDEFFKGLNSGIFSLWKQGCRQTIKSYIKHCNNDRYMTYDGKTTTTDFNIQDMPIEHYSFFKNQLPYYIDENLNLFVHGGFNRHQLIELQEPDDIYWWDRDLLACARSYASMKNTEYPFKIKGCEKGKFKEIFLGHTPVQYFGEDKPVKYANIWDLDIGAGKFDEGKICIMNVDTKEYVLK